MAVDVVHQSQSIFDTSDKNTTGILPQQTSTSSPNVSGLSTATGMILPDTSLQYRLRHMPDELYDLRPTSHLVRFIKALSGDSGVGQLRKRYMQSQFQSILSGTHFYDLDRFYGALFGAQRRSDETLDVDPLTDLATPDSWDAVAASDARYRERLIALAKAITLGATIPGLRAAAEALTGVPCEIYETWALLDSTGASPGAGRTWDDMEATFATWDPMENSTWQSIEGAVQYGRSGSDTRGEVIIRPKKTYGTDEQALRVEDEIAVVRVLSVLKPAGALLTVNSDGVPMHVAVPIASVEADSEYWEVVTKIKPAPGLTGSPYTGVSGQATPTPPLSGSQGTSWTYNQNITSVRSASALRDAHWPADGSLGVWYPQATSSNDIAVAANGTRTVYTPDKGVMDAKQAAAVRYASDGILVAAPYVGNRQPAVSAT
jgi:hypothetical protein